jgi:menaquinone-dependent protoporphyrinogen oxidase
VRVLVSAASKHGATLEIAQAIADGLARRGLDAHLRDPREVASLGGFDAVVLGSAVYAGHWMRPARLLADRLEAQLRARPVWLFSSGPIGDPHPKPEADPADVAPVMSVVGAVRHQLFCGKLDPDRMGFMERSLVHALRSPVGDFRDFDAIDAFAAEIAGALLASDTPAPPASGAATA